MFFLVVFFHDLTQAGLSFVFYFVQLESDTIEVLIVHYLRVVCDTKLLQVDSSVWFLSTASINNRGS